MIKKNIYILCLILISVLMIGCEPKDDMDQESDNDDSKGTVLMTQGTSKDENIIIDDGKVVVSNDDSLSDDPSTDSKVEMKRGKGRKEGIFGNPAYSEDAYIEYYMGPSSDGSDVTFTSMYGLHVENGNILAVEDIVFADLVHPETMSTSEKEATIQDIYNQMQNSNLSHYDGLEIIDAYNGYGNETATAFVYYVFDPEFAPLESYDQFLAYFKEKGFVALDNEASNDDMDTGSDDSTDLVGDDEDGYCEDTLYGTPLYADNAIVTYYIKTEDVDSYRYSYIKGLQTVDGELVAIEDIIRIELVNPDAYAIEVREALMLEKQEELLALGNSRAKGQTIIESFHGHSDLEAIQFMSYVFDSDQSNLADHEAYLIDLIESGFEYMQ